jgi:ribosomal protein S18 acetylase RimI-like enzyme
VETETIIRRTKEEDWESLKAIRLAALIDAPMAFGVSHATALTYTDSQWRERAAGRGQALFILAFSNNTVVGIVGCVLSSCSEFNLIAMWVAPPLRGTAAAAKLVGAVKAEAVLQGHSRIVLDVAPSNLRAVSFYQKEGFVFLPEWESLESHPHIQLQKMEWLASLGSIAAEG